ncbi:hypothetical protein VE01_09956 [Pseudogymnoascus verrucosus]|uniref:Adenosine deaminase domain-containing protein n=1 Tax=Pseudogymnoascus verrucosus TaxID=342668 RepID=A0A1B8G853_9PEZI|nr:uncharacterized protein VE01_09956 [Pseudogymnoascus verrucosus]OBT92002.1 hypothetical protein VE01_09956 [Pseudogymnoascus verrucosus]
MSPIPYNIIQEWERQVLSMDDPFIAGIPKIELHVHIEGTLTPELRWKLGQRNGISLGSKRLRKDFHSLEQLKQSYDLLRPRSVKGSGQVSAFFDAYYGGMEVLRVEEDFYDLAMDYFLKAAAMKVRYCEPSFDPQAHTRRGVKFETFMRGFRRAQIDADRKLNVKSAWIMCMLRDMPPQAAIEHYEAALPYKDMIMGVGLDSNEYDRPPSLFEELYLRARADGFKLTCHCDVTQKNTHEHIRQVAESVGGTGAERCDHGLDAAESPELVSLIKHKDLGVTLCPWAYVRHHTEVDLFKHIRTLFDAGIKVNISSDSPAYMESNWVTQNLLLVRLKCKFTNDEIAKVEKNGVEICWAPKEVKENILREIENFCNSSS